ncbi:hypothetical protein JHU04_001406 [Brenneria sp. 4F2]|nr:hypothetical protein [Brenneria bubanii]
MVTPVLMLAVSLAVRRWGGFVGGLLSGMPLTSGPVALFLAIEQGPQFATQAASGALSGLSAVLLTYLFYLIITRWLVVSAACISAVIFFVVISLLLLVSGSPVGAIFISLAAIATIVRITGRLERKVTKASAPFWDIPMRMLTSTAMLFAITGSAHILGPHVSGILSPVPVIAWPLTVFAHAQGGRSDMAAVVRGNAVSALGVIVFYVTIRELLLKIGLVATFSLAFAASVVVTMLLAEVMRRSVRTAA